MAGSATVRRGRRKGDEKRDSCLAARSRAFAASLCYHGLGERTSAEPRGGPRRVAHEDMSPVPVIIRSTISRPGKQGWVQPRNVPLSGDKNHSALWRPMHDSHDISL